MGADLPGWMANDFSVLNEERTDAFVRNDFLESFRQHRLAGCARAPLLTVPPAEGKGRSAGDGVPGGRGPVRIVPAGALGEAIVRPYRRGGFVEKFNRRTYFLGNRAFSELITTHRLWRRGAPVPEALAAVQSRTGLGYHGCFVTRRIPRSRPAARVLAGAPAGDRARILESIGRSVRRFHEAGGVHADLNAYNLLVQEEADDPVFVIDLDRAVVLHGPVGGRRARANLRRLHRSFAKLGLEGALSDWETLEEAYAAPPEPPPAA